MPLALGASWSGGAEVEMMIVGAVCAAAQLRAAGRASGAAGSSRRSGSAAARGAELEERLAVQRAGQDDGSWRRRGGRWGGRVLRLGQQPGGAADERLGADGRADRVLGRFVDSVDQRQGDALFAGGGDAGADRGRAGGDDVVGDQRDPAAQPLGQSVDEVRHQLPVLEQMPLEHACGHRREWRSWRP